MVLVYNIAVIRLSNAYIFNWFIWSIENIKISFFDQLMKYGNKENLDIQKNEQFCQLSDDFPMTLGIERFRKRFRW